jgi:leader peptidase (prepilin peptidase) / N-methyltransferase
VAEPSRIGRLRFTYAPVELAWISALASAADALLAWRLGASPELPAYLYFGVLCSVLAVLDVATRRVPNFLVLPSYPIAMILLGLGAYISGAWWPLARASIGMAVLGGFFLVLAVVFPGQLGLGDVKLAGLIGLYLAWFGSSALVVGVLVAWSSAALVVAIRRLQHTRGSLPLAPFLVLGTLIAILTV